MIRFVTASLFALVWAIALAKVGFYPYLIEEYPSWGVPPMGLSIACWAMSSVLAGGVAWEILARGSGRA